MNTNDNTNNEAAAASNEAGSNTAAPAAAPKAKRVTHVSVCEGLFAANLQAFRDSKEAKRGTIFRKTVIQGTVAATGCPETSATSQYNQIKKRYEADGRLQPGELGRAPKADAPAAAAPAPATEATTDAGVTIEAAGEAAAVDTNAPQLTWGVYDKKSGELVQAYATRDEARAALKKGQQVDPIKTAEAA